MISSSEVTGTRCARAPRRIGHRPRRPRRSPAGPASRRGVSISSSLPPGPSTTTAGSRRDPPLHRQHVVGSSFSGISGCSKSRCHCSTFRFRIAPATSVEELLGDAALARLLLVAEEQLDELPLLPLQPGGDGAVGGDPGGVAPSSTSGGTEASRRRRGPRRSISGVDHVGLPIGAADALQVVEDLDRDRSVVLAQPVVQLRDPADSLRTSSALVDPDRVGVALVEREAREQRQPTRSATPTSTHHPDQVGAGCAGLARSPGEGLVVADGEAGQKGREALLDRASRSPRRSAPAPAARSPRCGPRPRRRARGARRRSRRRSSTGRCPSASRGRSSPRAASALIGNRSRRMGPANIVAERRGQPRARSSSFCDELLDAGVLRGLRPQRASGPRRRARCEARHRRLAPTASCSSARRMRAPSCCSSTTASSGTSIRAR